MCLIDRLKNARLIFNLPNPHPWLYLVLAEYLVRHIHLEKLDVLLPLMVTQLQSNRRMPNLPTRLMHSNHTNPSCPVSLRMEKTWSEELIPLQYCFIWFLAHEPSRRSIPEQQWQDLSRWLSIPIWIPRRSYQRCNQYHLYGNHSEYVFRKTPNRDF